MLRKFPKLFKVSTAKHYARIALWLTKHLGLLLSAGVEVYLRRNLGRRYMLKVFLAFLLCAAYTTAAPKQAFLMRLFLFGFFVMVVVHLSFISARWRSGRTEPHSYFTGTSWAVWQKLRIQPEAAQRYFEPAVCLLLARLTLPVDHMFSLWLGASGLSLFVKEQMIRFSMKRRVLDMADSRIESQELGAAVDQYINPRAGQTEGFHRAHLPRTTRRPRREHE